MSRWIRFFRCNPFRGLTSAAETESVAVVENPYSTLKKPVYRLPFYGEDPSVVAALPDDTVDKALGIYGGLRRKRDDANVLRERLQRLVRADYRKKQLTISGVVVSNKMDKSVVVAARRAAYATKLKLKYYKTRRFMAHDELNLCREGDRVVIRSCRPLSRHKSHVVVENYGDPTRSQKDDRKIELANVVVKTGFNGKSDN